MADSDAVRSKRYRENNKAKVAAARKVWRETHREVDAACSTRYYRKHRDRMLFSSAKQRAKRKGIEFSITLEDIVIPEFCPVFGFRLEPSTTSQRADTSASLDRIDNNKGYTKDNIIVVSWLANRLKSNATVDQLRAVADFYEAQAKKVS